jgi:Outer membrane protein and related peptidoglycan-associated (lipo)proteins
MSKLKSISYVLIAAFVFLSTQAQANVLGNMQTFAPNPDSLVFNNIHASQTLDKNYFNVGFFAAYVRNELSTYDDLTTPSFVEYKDKAFTFDAIFGWGVTDHFELTYSVPGYFKQEPDSGQTRQHFISNGINGQRVGGKYDISQSKNGGFAVAGSVDFTSTEDNPYIGNSPAPIWNIEGIWDTKDRDNGYGVNIGYRKRTPGDPAANAYFLPVGDQLLASAAWVTGLSTKWRFHLEMFGSYGLKKDDHPEQRYINSLEGLIGGKYRLARNFWAHYGATVELLPKGLAPDYRIYVGLNHFFGFNSKDNKEITPTQSMTVTPYDITLAPEQKQTITVQGGQAPYKFALSKDLGYFDEKTMEYRASEQTGDEELTVTDATGATAIVQVHIRQETKTVDLAQSFTIAPADEEVYTGGVVQFNAIGGKMPYKAETSPAGFGTINSKTLKYQAPTRPGNVKIIVRDQKGQTAIANVRVIPVPAPAKAITLKNLNFVFNTAKLTPASEKELNKNVANLSQVRIKKIIVVGHTDNVGSDEYNQELSQSRAEAVAQILREKFNLSKQECEAVGYGESQPIATNNTDKGRSINRRVELKLYYNK